MTHSALSKLSPGLKMTILSLLMTSLLAGCGIRGNLKTPPPVFGSDSKVDPQRVRTKDLDKGDKTEDYDSLDDGGFEDDDDFESFDEDPLADL